MAIEGEMMFFAKAGFSPMKSIAEISDGVCAGKSDNPRNFFQ
jgi:hypothetical protein